MSKTYDILLNESVDKLNNSIIVNYVVEGEQNSISVFPKTNSINIIIGANNSGKSRFMRYLMSSKALVGVHGYRKLNQLVEEYNLRVGQFNHEYLDEPNKSYSYHRIITRALDGPGSYADKLKNLQQHRLHGLDTNRKESLFKIVSENKNRLAEFARRGITDDFFSNYSEIDSKTVKNFTGVKHIYIPTLRSAHSLFEKKDESFRKIEHDIFHETIQKYYRLNNEIEIFTGLHLHKSILNTRNSKRLTREQFELFEKFIGDNFFNGKRVDIVAEFDKDDALAQRNEKEIISVHVEGEQDRNLYELGDGIQALIILMYKIFMAKENSWIFIDEPELNLHPGMQRLFLEQIISNKDLVLKNLRYFISTHSNHFIDLTLENDDISIYSFSSTKLDSGENRYIVKNVNQGDNSVLRSLGVSNSSVFIANNSIWVEGISDRNYIKAFLRAYLKAKGNRTMLKEDIDYAFFEYAGSNIDHYLFEDVAYGEEKEIISKIQSMALNNRIFLLADSDNAAKGTPKFKRLKSFENAKRDNFEPYVIWNIREIENLLTTEIWSEVLISLCNKKLVSRNERQINDQIRSTLQSLNMAAYEDKYIGKFLSDVSRKLGQIDGENILNSSSYVSTSKGYGTLSDKRALSELVLKHDFSWAVFRKNPKIKKLTESIYRFIQAAN